MDNIARSLLPKAAVAIFGLTIVVGSMLYLLPSEPSFALILGLVAFPIAILLTLMTRSEYLWVVVVLSSLSLPYLNLRVETGALRVPIPAFLASSVLVGLLLKHLLIGATRHVDRRLLVAWLIFLGANLFSIYDSASLENSISFLSKWVFHGILFLSIIPTLRGRKNVRLLTFAFIGFAAMISVAGLYRYFVLETAKEIDLFSEYATRDAPSYYLAITLPLAIALLWDPILSRMNRGLIFLAVAASGVALVFTFTRAGWISVFLAVCVIGLFQKRAWLLLIAAIVVAALTAPQAVLNRLASIYVVTDVSGSPYRSASMERYYLILTAVNMIKAHPLMGVGVGTYSLNYHQYRQPGARPAPLLPHNEYLRTWAEGGIVAVGSLFWIMFIIFRRLYRGIAQTKDVEGRYLLMGYLGSAVSVFVYALLSNNLNTMLTWLILAVGMVMAEEVEEERSEVLHDLQR